MPATSDAVQSTAVPAPGGGGPRRPARRRAPVAIAAAATTGWAALVSLSPVLMVVLLAHVASGGTEPTGRVIQVGLAGWLLVHGVPLRTSVGTFGLVPLALTAFAAWRVVRAGVHTTRAVGGRKRRSLRIVPRVAVSVGVAYGLLGLLIGLFAGFPGLEVDAVRAGLTLAAFGCVAGGIGALRETNGYARLVRLTPPVVRDATRTGVVAALVMLAAGATAAGVSLALSGGAASKVLAAYHAGVAGQIGLTLLCTAYAPNVAVWAASYLVGPGFALGAGTVVSAGQVRLGPVPALPVLAGVPARPAAEWLGLLLAVPLAAGMTAGWLLVRRRLRAAAAADRGGGPDAGPDARKVPLSASTRQEGHLPGENRGEKDGAAVATAPGWVPVIGAALAAGPVAGAVLAAAAWVSAGPLGGDNLAEIGARPWPLAAVAAGLVSGGAAIAAGATRALVGVRRRGA